MNNITYMHYLGSCLVLCQRNNNVSTSPPQKIDYRLYRLLMFFLFFRLLSRNHLDLMSHREDSSFSVPLLYYKDNSLYLLLLRRVYTRYWYQYTIWRRRFYRWYRLQPCFYHREGSYSVWCYLAYIRIGNIDIWVCLN